jgi:hypothetical protein
MYWLARENSIRFCLVSLDERSPSVQKGRTFAFLFSLNVFSVEPWRQLPLRFTIGPMITNVMIVTVAMQINRADHANFAGVWTNEPETMAFDAACFSIDLSVAFESFNRLVGLRLILSDQTEFMPTDGAVHGPRQRCPWSVGRPDLWALRGRRY